MLSDGDILQAIQNGLIDISPLDPLDVQPASVDLHLGKHVRRLAAQDHHYQDFFGPELDVRNIHNDYTAAYEAEEDGSILIRPQEFLLVATDEVVTLGSAYGARVEGRSSLGRCGLLAHITAGFVDPGFSGNLTLELYNVSQWPIRLQVGMAICQLAIYELSSKSLRVYGNGSLGTYRGDKAVGPVPAEGNISKISYVSPREVADYKNHLRSVDASSDS